MLDLAVGDIFAALSQQVSPQLSYLDKWTKTNGVYFSFLKSWSAKIKTPTSPDAKRPWSKRKSLAIELLAEENFKHLTVKSPDCAEHSKRIAQTNQRRIWQMKGGFQFSDLSWSIFILGCFFPLIRLPNPFLHHSRHHQWTQGKFPTLKGAGFFLLFKSLLAPKKQVSSIW